MRKFVLTLFFPVLLFAAAEIKIGMTEKELLEIKGRPEGRMAAGSRAIYTWPGEKITCENGFVKTIEKLVEIKEETSASNKMQIVADDPKIWSFEFTDITLSWVQKPSSVEKSSIVVPQIQYCIRNNGNVPLKYLKLKFIFKQEENKIFDEVVEYAIGGGDTPLETGVTSRSYFTSVSVGFTPRRIPFLNLPDSSSLNYDTYSITKTKFSVTVYALSDSGLEFKRFGTFLFETSKMQWKP
jgi:hypothetical protein